MAQVQYDDFYREHRRRLVTKLCSMVDQRSVAEEIAQEAFHVVWQRWDEATNPASYLYRVAYNKANDELRKRRTARSKEHFFTESHTTERIYLTDLLTQMTPNQTKAIYLKYYGDKTHGEVAEIMDLPTGTVKSLIHRGLSDMRTCVS